MTGIIVRTMPRTYLLVDSVATSQSLVTGTIPKSRRLQRGAHVLPYLLTFPIDPVLTMTKYSLTQLIPTQDTTILSLAVCPDGRFTASGGSAGTLTLYRNPSLEPVHDPNVFLEPAYPITALTWSKTCGNCLLVGDSSSRISVVTFRAIEDGDCCIGTLRAETALNINDGRVNAIAVYGDLVAIEMQQSKSWLLPSSLTFLNMSTIVATYVGYGAVLDFFRLPRAWHLEHGGLLWTLRCQPHGIFRLALSPDGRLLATTGSMEGVTWFNTMYRSLLPRAVPVQTSHSGQRGEDIFYINDGRAMVLAGRWSHSLRIVHADPQCHLQILQVLNDPRVPASASISALPGVSELTPSTINLWTEPLEQRTDATIPSPPNRHFANRVMEYGRTTTVFQPMRKRRYLQSWHYATPKITIHMHAFCEGLFLQSYVPLLPNMKPQTAFYASIE
ncbi:hypothetical protein OF83DRAFT_1088458, partial [Amylostereum chailletii]